MLKRPLYFASAIIPLVLLLAACGGNSEGSSTGSAQEIAVTARERSANEYVFEPKEVTVPAGTKVTFVVKNEGTQDHEFESDEAHIEEIKIPKDRERKVTWTAPSQPGRFVAFCDLPGHRQKGMELAIVVK